jgi:raffinose/stachyose/melibiose transport system permease protein
MPRRLGKPALVAATTGQAASAPRRLADDVTVVGVGGPGPADRRRARRERARRKWTTVALFLLPALALYCLLVIAPIFQAIYYSGFKWSGLGPMDDFVGLQNFKLAFQDDVFVGALKHNGIIVLLSLAVQLPFALGIAMILNQRLKGRALLRLLFFMPFVLSEVVTAVVFTLMLQPHGLADQSLDKVGLHFLVTEWLANPSIVLYTVFVAISWKYFGFHMVLYLAGLQQIPHELEEAAAIDGANPWQIFRYVTLPLLGPTIRISVFLSIIGAIQLFDLVWVMTGGGPVDASNTMAVYMINHGFKRFQFGYASAVAVIMLVISLAIALTYQRFVLRRDIEGALTTQGR